jgi:hypothetical protein
MIELRSFNENGIAGFEDYLAKLTLDPKLDPPLSNLVDTTMTGPIPGNISVDETRSFADKMEAAKYLHDVLGPIGPSYNIRTNAGLWDWLAMCYFDQVCPKAVDGSRHIGEKSRYILPQAESQEHWMRYYRHLLAGPYDIYRIHGEKARLLLLNSDVATIGDIFEQLASRMEVITNPALMGALDALYFDKKKDEPKRGATNRKQAGNIRRFVSLIRQLDLTYDLYSLQAKEVLGLLPAEFNSWYNK